MNHSYTLEMVCGGWLAFCAFFTLLLAVKPKAAVEKAA